ncbi:hypothetical protein [Cyanophage S-TIM5]|uniref:Uncharacterized protein n=1 Tax=Cyanophage S-TIM5 TaxID=1137745 RepID=H6WFZ3_9CAUD|nr:hypothetical protein F417_gp095 [Cyanophage S-TIM5]AEZ65718.1 hypothetical protein [Cyanophage S-TIM5]UYE96885.1 hypothetical protein [Cyanophage S-TIM66]UYE97097.1 hypothetical protein [Cyanophage S-TIM61]
MKKLLVLPMMLATAGILGGTAVEAKPRMFHDNPGGGDFISVPRPKKRCTFKRPCSRMPELPFLPDEITPMNRGGLAPYPGTQWR